MQHKNFYARSELPVLPDNAVLATHAEQSSAITYTDWFSFELEDAQAEASIVSAHVFTSSGTFRTTFLAISKNLSDNAKLDFAEIGGSDYFETHDGQKFCASQIFPEYFTDTSPSSIRYDIYDKIITARNRSSMPVICSQN